MKYIPLDKVISTIVNYYPINHSWMELEDFISKIYSIKTIDLSIIDEMIDYAESRVDNYIWDEWNSESEYEERVERLNTLQELKERLSLNK